MTSVELEVRLSEALSDVAGLDDAVDKGASRSVRQLAILAEAAMKEEAPEGAGRDKHLRDTIDTRFRRGGKRADVGARKRVDGTLLATYVVEGTDPGSYGPNFPEDAPPIGPLMDWADAKFGDPDAAWALRRSIFETGHRTLPNPYVDRSLDKWEDRVGELAGEAVRDAIDEATRGA